MTIQKVAVLGAGTMGNGIAQVVAEAGYPVVMMDLTDEMLKKGMQTIGNSLQRGVDKGRRSAEQKAATMARITLATRLEDAAKADLVIEAVPEDLAIKKKTFTEMDRLCAPHTILASNTSSLPISAIASATRRPEKVVGMHFMNPVPVMQGVEIIRGLLTSEETLAMSKAFVEKLGKVPVEAVDYTGFVVSRVLDVMLNEAVYCVMDGNRPEEIDKAMKVCTNFPMGPLELIDLAGADVLLHVMEAMQAEFGDRCRPAPLLRKMVNAGQLGRKTGRGFYDYTAQKR